MLLQKLIRNLHYLGQKEICISDIVFWLPKTMRNLHNLNIVADYHRKYVISTISYSLLATKAEKKFASSRHSLLATKAEIKSA